MVCPSFRPEYCTTSVTKLTKVVASKFAEQGIDAFFYLDDWMISADSEAQSLSSTQKAITCSKEMGFAIYLHKSSLILCNE